MRKIAIMYCSDFYDASPYLPSETVLGQPIVNGVMCAAEHDFTDEDIQYFIACGAEMVEKLPEGWIKCDELP